MAPSFPPHIRDAIATLVDGSLVKCSTFARDVSLQLRLQFFVIPQGKAGLAEGNPMNEQPLAENYIFHTPQENDRRKRALASAMGSR